VLGYRGDAMSRLSEYAGARELTLNLTLRELRSRYKKSILGWTWSLLNPLTTVLIYSVIFSFFLKVDPPKGDPSGLDVFPLFLLCGLLPWNFLSAGMTTSIQALIANSNLIKKVYFPREILVVSTVLSLVITFLVEMSVLLVALLLFGNMVIPWIPVVLLLMVIESFMVLGVGLMLSTLNVYFRDIQHLVNVAMTALFYSMPIVYPISFVAERKETILGLHIIDIYRLNPLVRMVSAYRAALYDLKFPALTDIGYFAVWAFGLCALGLFLFRKFERRLAEEL